MKRNKLTVMLCALLCLGMILPGCSATETEIGAGTNADTKPDGEPTVPATDAQTAQETETEAETVPADVTDIALSFDETFLCLKVGDTVALGGNIGTDKYAQVRETVLYANGDSGTGGAAVATYADGQVTAVGGGCAYLEAVNPYTGRTARTLVRVIDRANDETCIIGAPIWDYRFMNETQMKYIAEAGFNAIFMSHAPDEDIISFLTSAEPYGVKVYPQLATPDVDELSMSADVIRSRIDKFRQYKAFGGFNLRDEPSYFFDDYANVAQLVYEYDPSLIAMINFLPNATRETLYNYGARLHDDSYKGVLSFDNYIFTPAPGSVSETWLFRNFELYRQAGIDNRCRTAFYLQSIGSGTYGYRRPDEGTMFYHAMVSLAYGCTMMRYFSYVTPNTYEYTSGVIDIDGTPTDLYDVTCDLNRQYASFGLWLIHANADEVYHTGGKLESGADYQIVPDGYWITPADDREAAKRTILTTFTDRYTGQNYLMAVNKDFSADITVTYRLNDVPCLWEVDPVTGLLTEVDVSGGELTLSLTKGNARLFVLPYGKTYTAPKSVSENRMRDAYVTVSSVSDSTGSCVEYLWDGRTVSADGCMGWRAAQSGDGAWVRAAFDTPTALNRVDVYPAGNGAGCGRFFPQTVEVQISDNGKDWTTVATLQKPDKWDTGLSVTFETVTAKYVRLYMPTLYVVGNDYQCEIGEICLFNDTGSIAPAGKTDYEPLVVKPGVNVALGKKCCDYSSVQNTMEWHEHEVYLTDGDNSQQDYYAFSTAICRNGSARAHEYFVLDLENAYPINKIVLYPNCDGSGFPTAYTVQVSPDGQNWTVVLEEKRTRNKGEIVTIEFDTMDVAFIKLDATVLTMEANPNAGYVLQVAELEAYTPAE